MEKDTKTPCEEAREIQGTTISLELAKTRVSRWLQIVGSMPGFEDDSALIPRAIFICLEDIKELEKAYPPETLKGIRIYLGVAGEDQPTGPSVTDLRGMIVPVIKTDKHGKPHEHFKIGNPANPNDTAIYDFTTPCPAYCDPASELYVPYK